jgi:hypothetical protein
MCNIWHTSASNPARLAKANFGSVTSTPNLLDLSRSLKELGD